MGIIIPRSSGCSGPSVQHPHLSLVPAARTEQKLIHPRYKQGRGQNSQYQCDQI